MVELTVEWLVLLLSHWGEAARVMLRYWMQHACICDTLNLCEQSTEQQGLVMIQLKSNASTVESTLAAGCGVQWATESMICWLDVASTSIIATHIQNEGYRNLKYWCCGEITMNHSQSESQGCHNCFQKRVKMPVRIKR